MRSMRLCRLIGLILLLAALSAALLCACTKDNVPFDAYLQGVAYRGAELDLYATVTDAELANQITFTVTEGQGQCYIYGGKLKILNTATVGATIAVTVQAGGYSQVLWCTVGATPVEAVELAPIAPMAAGDSVTLSALITPAYADDNPIRYTVIEGGDVAVVQGDVLTLSTTADKADHVRVVAEVGGVRSAPQAVSVSTVQATAVSAEGATLHRGDSVVIQPVVSPADATVAVNCALRRTTFVDLYVTLEGNTLRVAADATEGEFDVDITAGNAAAVVHYVVAKTPVTTVVLSRQEEGDTVCYGDYITTACRVYPADATYRDVTYSVADGAEFVEQTDEGVWRVTTRQVGVSILITAIADGCLGHLRLTTVGVPVRQVVLSADGNTSVQVGDVRHLSGQILPTDAEGTIAYTVVEGQHLCALDRDVITFTQMDTGNDTVVVCGTVGDTSGYLTFHIVPVPVQSVTIATTDATIDLVAGQTVCFTAEVLPANATYATLTYQVVEGSGGGTFDDNVFTVQAGATYGTVVVQAVSADGVYSNTVTLSIVPDAYQPTLSGWSSLDARPHLFDNHSAVLLDLSAMPANADECVVVVSDDVDVLTIVGRYRGDPGTCFTNLYFYFLTTDAISVYLRDVGIYINNGFTDTVLDFGGRAAVTLVAEGDNYIAAGSAYALSTIGFLPSDTLDDLRLMDGMDGFAGQDGGTAVCAYDLTLSGAGTLVLVGGDASSGTDGTPGLSTTDSNTYAGNGGMGGNGGVGGYAIYAHSITYDFTGDVSLTAGASGTAGVGGSAGTGVSPTYHGKIGRDGTAGTLHDAVYADTTIMRNGRPARSMGALRERADTRTFVTVANGVALLSNHFKVNVVYAAGWTSGGHSGYTMTQMPSDETGELLRLLHGLDYALQAVGHNVLIDASYRYKINIYLCKSIKQSGSTIYGLTDDVNNVWYSAFSTRKRDSFYSTYYNIMVHELMHVLYFQSSNTTQTALGAGALATYNGGLGYYQRNSGNNNSVGVYDSTIDNGAMCGFLTKYSKYNNREDISETLSILCIQAGARSFTKADSRIAAKARYISSVFAAEYAALDEWKPMQWLRYVQ